MPRDNVQGRSACNPPPGSRRPFSQGIPSHGATLAEPPRGTEGPQPPVQHIVDAAMGRLGIHDEQMSSPAVIRTLLVEMKLADFEPSSAIIRRFLDDARSAPQPLGPLIRATRQGIAANPALVDFLHTAFGHGWLEPSAEVQKSLHQMFLLEAFTAAMCNDHELLQELQHHILAVRETFGLKPHDTLRTLLGALRATGSSFVAIKTISVDPAVAAILYLAKHHGQLPSPKELKELRRQGKLGYAEMKNLMRPSQTPTEGRSDHSGLALNIKEAAITEYRRGFKDNAFAGHVLAELLRVESYPAQTTTGPVCPKTLDAELYRSLTNGDNHHVQNRFSQDFVSLYETWNLCFILSEMEELDILFPKLLIPSVLSADPKTYLRARVVSLWLAIHHYTMRRIDKTTPVTGPARRSEIASAWGAINERHAVALARKSKRLTVEECRDTFESFFRHPYWNLFKAAIFY